MTRAREDILKDNLSYKNKRISHFYLFVKWLPLYLPQWNVQDKREVAVGTETAVVHFSVRIPLHITACGLMMESGI